MCRHMHCAFQVPQGSQLASASRDNDASLILAQQLLGLEQVGKRRAACHSAPDNDIGGCHVIQHSRRLIGVRRRDSDIENTPCRSQTTSSALVYSIAAVLLQSVAAHECQLQEQQYCRRTLQCCYRASQLMSVSCRDSNIVDMHCRSIPGLVYSIALSLDRALQLPMCGSRVQTSQ